MCKCSGNTLNNICNLYQSNTKPIINDSIIELCLSIDEKSLIYNKNINDVLVVFQVILYQMMK